jgi:anti-sigma factor RsiW
MTGCPDWQERLQGLIDGELDAAHATEAEAHMAGCTACSEAYAAALMLRTALRGEGVYAKAPDRLAVRLDAAVRAASAPAPAFARSPRGERRSERAHWGFGAGGGALAGARWGFGGAGVALAACALVAFMVAPMLQTAQLEQELVAGHVRSQQVGHLIDVVTSDQHVVKPWFGGKIDFSPPVVDLADQGFPIVGGRLDYIGKRTVAAIVYRRGRHVINVFVWPGQGGPGPSEAKPGDGYTLLHWTRGGMTFWAVSDVNEKDLQTFRQLLQARTPA